MAGRDKTARRSPAKIHESADGTRQRRLLIALFVVVIVTDQAVKWWVWRYFDGTLINSGGYILLGRVIRSWFATPVGGAVADVAGSVLVIVGVRRLLRRRRTTAVLVGGGLFAAGWASNLADRLGLHSWTAPHSARGVVDFIPGGGPGRANVADLWIVAGALLLAYGFARRATRESHAAHAPVPRHPWQARVAGMITLLAIVVLAVLGAIDHDGVHTRVRS